MDLHTDDPKEEDTYAHRCVDRAISFLEEFKDKDFFLTVSLDEPHDPSICPKRFIKELKNSKFKMKRTPNVNASLKDKPEHQKIWSKAVPKMPFCVFRKTQNSFLHCREWRNGIKPSFKYTGYTRQQVEDDFVQCDYATGLPMKESVRKK